VETETTSQHVLSVFVTDEAGLINQVTQVFSDAGRTVLVWLDLNFDP
jgi:glycine cleavage system regulatory protein